MPRTEGSTGQTVEEVRNIHVDAPESFHRRLKVQSATKGMKLKDYVLLALKAQLEKDEKAAR